MVCESVNHPSAVGAVLGVGSVGEISRYGSFRRTCLVAQADMPFQLVVTTSSNARLSGNLRSDAANILRTSADLQTGENLFTSLLTRPC